MMDNETGYVDLPEPPETDDDCYCNLLAGPRMCQPCLRMLMPTTPEVYALNHA